MCLLSLKTKGALLTRVWRIVGPVDLGLDRNDIQKLGVDPDTVVRYPNGVYMVELEFSHQLHCLVSKEIEINLPLSLT